ncbi:MAG: CHAT domain-containing protein [Bacteroidetes bacterium]|nr:CHAT domain-containing protein [Bacteroidota bacterium]
MSLLGGIYIFGQWKIKWIFYFVLSFSIAHKSFAFDNVQLQKKVFDYLVNSDLQSADSVVNNEIVSEKAKGQNLNLFQLYLIKANNHLQFSLIEEFKMYTDSAECFLIKKFPQENIYSTKIYINRSKYYSYKTNGKEACNWGIKAKNTWLNKKADSDKIEAYKIYSVLGTASRNYANGSYDNIFKFFDTALVLYNQQTQKDLYSLALLYKAIANAHGDRFSIAERSNEGKKYHYEKAIELLEKGLSILETSYKNDLRDIASFHSLLGLYHYYGKNYKESIIQYNKSIKVFKGIESTNIKFDLLIPSYMNTINLMCMTEDSLQINYSEKEMEEKYNLLIESEESFVNFVRKSSDKEKNGFVDVSGISPYKSIIPTLYQLYSKSGKEKYAYKIFEFSEKSKQLQIIAKQSVHNVKAKKDESILNGKVMVEDIQSSISNDEALIEYFLVQKVYYFDLYAMIITKNKFSVIKLRNPLRENFQFLERNGSVNSWNTMSLFKAQYYRNYKLHLEDIEPVLINKIKKLLIVPSGRSMALNFELMLSDTLGNDYRNLNYLIKKYEIRYLFNASSINQESNYTDTIKTAMFVAPTYKNIRFSEIKVLSNYLTKFSNKNTIFYKGDTINKETIVSSFEKSDFLFLCGHMNTYYSGPPEPCFYLEDSKSDTGKAVIAPKDFIGKNLNSKLVFIAACSGNIGFVDQAEGNFSFAHTFFNSGAKSIISNVFEFDEYVGKKIIEDFFLNLKEGSTKSTALRDAKLSYIAQCNTSKECNPALWGSLVIYGNDNPLVFGNKESYFNLWTYAALVIAGFTLVYYAIRKPLYKWLKRRSDVDY